MSFSFGGSAVVAVLGYAVVFIGLAMLLCVVILLGRILTGRRSRAARAGMGDARGAQPEEVTVVRDITDLRHPDYPPAPGSAGAVKLHDVPDRTAAMLMAIVADNMGRPVNELRFISIKEVK